MASKADKITLKEEGFIQSLLAGETQHEAYVLNYSTKNMKYSSIDVAAWKVLNRPKIKQRYEELNAKLKEKAEQEGLMNATDLLRKLNELILRNEDTDDRLALEGMKTLGKNLGTFVDKIEHSGEIKMPGIIIGK